MPGGCFIECSYISNSKAAEGHSAEPNSELTDSHRNARTTPLHLQAKSLGQKITVTLEMQ
ncbi:hypothetical protein DSO57_1016773, partial [Entomophthora muscae]